MRLNEAISIQSIVHKGGLWAHYNPAKAVVAGLPIWLKLLTDMSTEGAIGAGVVAGIAAFFTDQSINQRRIQTERDHLTGLIEKRLTIEDIAQKTSGSIRREYLGAVGNTISELQTDIDISAKWIIKQVEHSLTVIPPDTQYDGARATTRKLIEDLERMLQDNRRPLMESEQPLAESIGGIILAASGIRWLIDRYSRSVTLRRIRRIHAECDDTPVRCFQRIKQVLWSLTHDLSREYYRGKISKQEFTDATGTVVSMIQNQDATPILQK